MVVFRTVLLLLGLLLSPGLASIIDSEIKVKNLPLDLARRQIRDGDQHPYINILQDTLFSNGFEVYMVEDGIPNLPLKVVRDFNYNKQRLGPPRWQLAQWNNYNNNLRYAKVDYQPPYFIYSVEDGNKVEIDPRKGSLKLTLNTSKEYGKNALNPNNPRISGQKWPHLLVSQDYRQGISLSKQKNIRLVIGYTVENVVDNHLNNSFDPNLHSAQFQWFIKISNRNPKSLGFEDFFWFGLSFYDFRYEFSPFYANADFNTTAKFIYMPDMKEVLGEGNQTMIGAPKKVDFHILDHLKKAYKLAKERGFLSNSTWEDLHVTHTNIGWEIPGSFDAGCHIEKIAIYARSIR